MVTGPETADSGPFAAPSITSRDICHQTAAVEFDEAERIELDPLPSPS
jgi:hypothetical protein